MTDRVIYLRLDFLSKVCSTWTELTPIHAKHNGI